MKHLKEFELEMIQLAFVEKILLSTSAALLKKCDLLV